jgi:hypothetical protein
MRAQLQLSRLSWSFLTYRHHMGSRRCEQDKQKDLDGET